MSFTLPLLDPAKKETGSAQQNHVVEFAGDAMATGHQDGPAPPPSSASSGSWLSRLPVFLRYAQGTTHPPHLLDPLRFGHDGLVVPSCREPLLCPLQAPLGVRA